jgi:hypothetical protein
MNPKILHNRLHSQYIIKSNYNNDKNKRKKYKNYIKKTHTQRNHVNIQPTKPDHQEQNTNHKSKQNKSKANATLMLPPPSILPQTPCHDRLPPRWLPARPDQGVQTNLPQLVVLLQPENASQANAHQSCKYTQSHTHTHTHTHTSKQPHNLNHQARKKRQAQAIILHFERQENKMMIMMMNKRN